MLEQDDVAAAHECHDTFLVWHLEGHAAGSAARLGIFFSLAAGATLIYDFTCPCPVGLKPSDTSREALAVHDDVLAPAGYDEVWVVVHRDPMPTRRCVKLILRGPFDKSAHD